MRIDDDEAVFDYPAKSGQRRVQTIGDPAVVEVLAALKRRRGGPDELLAWRDGRRWVDVRSDDINEYLKDRAGAAVTAKDFRTWNGTVLAAVALARRADRPSTKNARSARSRRRCARSRSSSATRRRSPAPPTSTRA